ncbi:glycoside hydrolase family 15 protein [Kribbella sp. NBC_01510]
MTLPQSLARTLATSGDLREGPSRSAHPPIADYAFLSDCESNCLIAPSGAVEWMCLPRHDSPSVFGAIVDRAAGSFRLASLLLLPLLRFLPADDPRVRATVRAIADELTEDGMVLRYRVSETDDGMHGAEGTFTICSFWLVSALVEIGELDQATALCEKLLSYASPLGLYAEELDPLSGRHLGNFPQAFTHLAMINAITHIIRAEEATGPNTFVPAHQRL